MQAEQDGGASLTASDLVRRVQELLLGAQALDQPVLVHDFGALSVGTKIRTASALCAAAKRAGYPHECSYPQLLYPVEKDAQDLIHFLESINARNAVEDASVLASEGASETVMDSAGLSIDPDARGWAGVAAALQQWTMQPARKSRVKPIVRRQYKGVQLRAGPDEPPQGAGSPDMEATQRKERDGALIEEWKALEKEYRANAARLGRMNAVARAREEQNKKLEARLRALEKAQQLFQADAKGNLQRLIELVAESEARLLALVTEWEQHRIPLVDTVKTKSQQKAELDRQQHELVKSLNALQDELADIRDRIASARTLKEGEDRVVFVPGKGSEMRAGIVLRVLDAVKQLRKQTAEAEKTVLEVEEVQGELARALERLSLIEAEIDDIIFFAAKQHPVGVEAYEFFTEAVEMFDELMNLQRNTHLAELELQDRTARAHALAGRVSALRLETIVSDLERMREENQALRARLGAGAGS